MEKKRRMKRRGIATLLATALLVALMAIPAAAATTYGTGVEAQNVIFNKILVIKAGDNVPAVNFDFTVSVPEQKIAATPTTLEVLRGVGTPTIATVSFDNNDSKDSTTKVTGYDTITKAVTVNFSGISFTEPGVYRYYIEEVNNTSQTGVVYDVSATAVTTAGDRYRTLDVYVEDASGTDLGLKITGYVLYDGKITAGPAVPGTGETPTSGTAITADYTIQAPAATAESRIDGAVKTDNIMNYYDAYNLTFSKTVTGNQGSKDKYFEFTLEMTGPAGNVYSVDITNADASPTDTEATTVTVAANPTTITGDATTGKVTQKFYLQHGQSITVKGLARAATYTISENNEDYTASADVTGDTDNTVTVTDGKSASDTGITENVTVAFTNNKEGIIPTGILLSATPWIILGLVVIAGIVFFAIRSRKKYEEE